MDSYFKFLVMALGQHNIGKSQTFIGIVFLLLFIIIIIIVSYEGWRRKKKTSRYFIDIDVIRKIRTEPKENIEDLKNSPWS